MAKYVYPAFFYQKKRGGYSVSFPDLDGCYTCGDDLQDAIMMAEDCCKKDADYSGMAE